MLLLALSIIIVLGGLLAIALGQTPPPASGSVVWSDDVERRLLRTGAERHSW